VPLRQAGAASLARRIADDLGVVCWRAAHHIDPVFDDLAAGQIRPLTTKENSMPTKLVAVLLLLLTLDIHAAPKIREQLAAIPADTAIEVRLAAGKERIRG